MTFCFTRVRGFPKLWKNNSHRILGPGQSYLLLFLKDCGISYQTKWFTLQVVSPQSNKPVNLPIAKASSLRKVEGYNSKQNSSGSHYFAAGSAQKRSQRNPPSKDHVLPSVKKKTLKVFKTIQVPLKPLDSKGWDKLKEDFTGRATFESCIISEMARCGSSLDVAKSLLAWVAAKNNGIVSYDLLVRYLYLCVFHKQTSEVIDVYEIMKSRYKCLETEASTLLIQGLSCSDRWRDTLLLLEDIKKVRVPSKRNYNDCIHGALIHQDSNLAWDLYQELISHDIIPKLETLKTFFDFAKDIKDEQYSNKLLDILLYLRNNQLYPGESFAHSIKTWFESLPGEQWKGQFTTVHKSGQCLGCGKAIESIHLSPEEYEYLKEKVLRDVIDGGDQYRKTTPEELKRFKNFVNFCPPFDIVIDGLNVAKMFPQIRDSELLAYGFSLYLLRDRHRKKSTYFTFPEVEIPPSYNFDLTQMR
ncbi:mitochondrial ribonuclease P catalytic subunit isoform X2 [Erinaceus europaeus]|uniref:ribonuclease P n=1 Tax=Erinaceus europaeus TaxID=9365 RepID=A0ABM3W4A7_ERIEU|nr:mitochondrial ribonuclease P catalytic subunit isoform X2 [Erinaceus europaeus]